MIKSIEFHEPWRLHATQGFSLLMQYSNLHHLPNRSNHRNYPTIRSLPFSPSSPYFDLLIGYLLVAMVQQYHHLPHYYYRYNRHRLFHLFSISLWLRPLLVCLRLKQYLYFFDVLLLFLSINQWPDKKKANISNQFTQHTGVLNRFSQLYQMF